MTDNLETGKAMSVRMSDLGEKKFIASLLPELGAHPTFVNGFGHDASVIDLGLGDNLLALNIDRVSRPIAAERKWSSYRMWGRLAITVSCSDLLAIGASPRATMISISVPGAWLASDVHDIVSGCAEECERNGVAFVGGDTKEGMAPQVVACSAGVVARGSYLGRTGAQAGDEAVLAGTLGGFLGSYFQLVQLVQQDATDRAEWIQYLAEPRAQWDVVGKMSRERGVKAGIDLSDGLYEAVAVLTQGGLGIEIDLESLPYHESAVKCARNLNIPLTNLAFGVGDWGILYAVSSGSADQLKAALLLVGVELTTIGRFTAGGGITAYDQAGRRYRLREFRNENFRRRMEDETDYMEQVSSDQMLLPM